MVIGVWGLGIDRRLDTGTWSLEPRGAAAPVLDFGLRPGYNLPVIDRAIDCPPRPSEPR
jgi:hypothetical protein